jgi:hypothetical protein
MYAKLRCWLYLLALTTSLILGDVGLLFSLTTPLDVSASQGSFTSLPATK